MDEHELDRIRRRLLGKPPAQRVEPNDDLMTVWEFVRAVESGAFIDYDGHGYYSADGKTYEWHDRVSPSDIKKLGVRGGFTHVVWFNR